MWTRTDLGPPPRSAGAGGAAQAGYLTCASRARRPPSSTAYSRAASWNSGSESERTEALRARRWRVRISARRHVHQGHGDRAVPGRDDVRGGRRGNLRAYVPDQDGAGQSPGHRMRSPLVSCPPPERRAPLSGAIDAARPP
jgi:hypothetical protein